tara:strand:- start:369 stop:488 length:120 start_codon:yes stop_codon:yes gene_type:complete
MLVFVTALALSSLTKATDTSIKFRGVVMGNIFKRLSRSS